MCFQAKASKHHRNPHRYYPYSIRVHADTTANIFQQDSGNSWKRLVRSVPSSVFCEDKKSPVPSELDHADRSNVTTERTVNFPQTTAGPKNLLRYQKYREKKIDLVSLWAKAKPKSVTPQTTAH